MDAQALGRLPGHLVFRRGGLTVCLPVATMLRLSVALTVLLSVVSWLLRWALAERRPRGETSVKSMVDISVANR